MPLIHGPKLGLSGRYRFHVLHPVTGKPITGRGGVPIYRDDSGFVRRAGIWHPNLITNRGLDEIADHNFMSSSGVRSYLKVGSGNAAPAVTDAALATYVGETTAAGPNNNQFGVTYDDTGTPFYRASFLAHKLYTASGSEDLREFGFDNESGDNASVRELLRDELGDPTTVSLTAGQQLGIEHEGIVDVVRETAVSFDVVEKNLAGTTIETLSYTGKMYPLNKSGNTLAFAPDYFASNNLDVVFMDSRQTVPTTLDDIDIVGNWVRYTTANNLAESYTPGNYYRDTVWRMSASDVLTGNNPIKAVFAGSESSNDLDYGWFMQLDDPQGIPKSNTHRLDLVVRLAWARA